VRGGRKQNIIPALSSASLNQLSSGEVQKRRNWIKMKRKPGFLEEMAYFCINRQILLISTQQALSVMQT
jgi:hypothetical protein